MSILHKLLIALRIRSGHNETAPGQGKREYGATRHPYMDLRLKREPCDTCNRWSECNGVDKANCPLYEAEKDVWQ